jgi:N-acyl-D-aspartate/D-glutamate deacylase
MGEADRRAGADDLAAMRALVRAGMEEGAWGLSSGPFYAPGSYADTAELVELARVAAAFDGAYQSHVRDESNYTIGLLAALEEVITVAREAGLPGVHTHVKALGPPVWGMGAALVERIEAARAAGVEVYADQYPYLASATGLAPALVPRWAQAGGDEALAERLVTEPEASRIRAAMVENLARRGGAERIQFRRVEWDPALEGRRLADVAAEWELAPVDAAREMLLRGRVGIVSFNMDGDDVRTLMTRPWTLTASDGGLVPWQEGVPHPRNYGTFPRRLRRFVVEEQLQPLEDAIRSMTSLPAQVYRMPERGALRPGLVADVVAFDPDAFVDLATFTDPHQLAEGMTHVLVAGRFAIRDGAATGELAGRVLRRR